MVICCLHSAVLRNEKYNIKVKYMRINRMKTYSSPTLEIYKVTMERGFAQSLGGDLSDYVPGENDSTDN